ncbi:MAG: GyrI-like domain-containing protein [Saprospiraceae bacterium]|nr:GyrI-like domain-containing protein [Saprospiraceae bacterium]
MQKQNYRKDQKQYYQPGIKPGLITLPSLKFFIIQGQGNPNDEFFGDYIQVLYALSYAVKMSPRQGKTPEGYFDYTVFPLEGVWDILDEAKADFTGTIDKNTLIFNLMIRQPDFVSIEFAAEIIEHTKYKKKLPLLEKVKFESIEEGMCVQMMHIGPFDDEPQSFQKMEDFNSEHGLKRISKLHREIYLSDPRKTAPEKLRTVLRFQSEKI